MTTKLPKKYNYSSIFRRFSAFLLSCLRNLGSGPGEEPLGDLLRGVSGFRGSGSLCCSCSSIGSYQTCSWHEPTYHWKFVPQLWVQTVSAQFLFKTLRAEHPPLSAGNSLINLVRRRLLN